LNTFVARVSSLPTMAFASAAFTPGPVSLVHLRGSSQYHLSHAEVPSWKGSQSILLSRRRLRSVLVASKASRIVAATALSSPFPNAEVIDVFKDVARATGASVAETCPVAVVIVPGYGSDASQYIALARVLAHALGPALVTIRVAPVRWHTWLRTLGGLPVTAVLEAIDTAVDEALAESGAARVTVVAHSAGGWISRIWLSRDAAYHGTVWRGAERAQRLICLGTPQTSAEPVTQRNMLFVAEMCADCAEAPDVEYICLCGSGVGIPEDSLVDGWSKMRFWDSATWMARISYEITVGRENASIAMIGDGKFHSRYPQLLNNRIHVAWTMDQLSVALPGRGLESILLLTFCSFALPRKLLGIVPTAVAFLNGARNIVLDGVWHSPTSPGPWYGDPRAVAYWSKFLL
jgi:pimeloyl-ACP methyl ester carboxylesterase